MKRSGFLQPFEKEYFRKDGSCVTVLIGVASFDEAGGQGVAFVLEPDTHNGYAGVRLDVKECGTGLHTVEMDRLFEASYTTKSQGMGLGLPISRSSIEAHGGRLWAESNNGPGATFTFSLPAASIA